MRTSIAAHPCIASKISFSLNDARFQEPVWLDVLTGNIHAIPADQITVDSANFTFNDVPVYDGPAAIIDKSLLEYVPARPKKKSNNPMAAGTD